jgi:hypothetical protein
MIPYRFHHCCPGAIRVSGTWDRHRPSKANEIRLNEIGTKSYFVYSSPYRCLIVSHDHGRNSLFEPVWNRNYIDYVEITAAETVGVENRAAFYEETGALRDMVANHLLQLLALTAMEPPVAFDADSVREQKVQVSRSIRPMSVEDVARFTARGQYGSGVIDGKPVLGYRQEPGMNRNSSVGRSGSRTAQGSRDGGSEGEPGEFASCRAGSSGTRLKNLTPTRRESLSRSRRSTLTNL